MTPSPRTYPVHLTAQNIGVLRALLNGHLVKSSRRFRLRGDSMKPAEHTDETAFTGECKDILSALDAARKAYAGEGLL